MDPLQQEGQREGGCVSLCTAKPLQPVALAEDLSFFLTGVISLRGWLVLGRQPPPPVS